MTYDVVITNGRVIDGTGNPWFHGDVAIKGGKIVKIGKITSKSSRRVIDAKGMAVSPGFIDLHTHTDLPVLADGSGESSTVAPLRGQVLEEYKEQAKRRAGVDVDWTTLEGYFKRLSKKRSSINIASSVSPQQIRKVVVGFEDRPATPEEIEKLPAQTLKLKDRGILKEGYWADVVIFDPATVSDPATYKNPQQYAKGIPFVLVNGAVVIDNGNHTGARPRKVIYGPGKNEAGRQNRGTVS